MASTAGHIPPQHRFIVILLFYLVHQVTRDNFAQLVLESDKDVLLMFHSEVCSTMPVFGLNDQ